MRTTYFLLTIMFIVAILFYCSTSPYDRSTKKIKVRKGSYTTNISSIEIQETTSPEVIAEIAATKSISYGFEEYNDQWFISASNDCPYIVSTELPNTGAKSLKVGPADCIAGCHQVSTIVSLFLPIRRKMASITVNIYETNAQGSGLGFGGNVQVYIDGKQVAGGSKTPCWDPDGNEGPVPTGWKKCTQDLGGIEGKEIRIEVRDTTNRTIMYIDDILINFV